MRDFLSLLPIIEIPDPVLRKRARKVRRIDKSILKLANNMVDTLREAGGVGLAANQVGKLQRIIVIQLPDECDARIYVNPEIVKIEGQREVEEGCLSIPGYRGKILRSVTIKFGALDHSSKRIRIDADGLLAQAIEHEVDHLNGILYTDHLRKHEDFYMIEEDHIETENSDINSHYSKNDSSIIVPRNSDEIIFQSDDSYDGANEKNN